MPLRLEHTDIVKSGCEILVAPTDSKYSGSGGADYAIHKAAGPELDAACADLSPLGTGEVRFTYGFNTGARGIIHTVGPIWQGGAYNEESLLRCCYKSCLMLACEKKAESIAFPLISSGTYGFPKDRVLKIAMEAISSYLYDNDTDIECVICIYDKNSYEIRGYDDLDEYIDARLNNKSLLPSKSKLKPIIGKAKFLSDTVVNHFGVTDQSVCYSAIEIQPYESVDDWLKKHDGSFQETLEKLIDLKGMTTVECYKKANVSRKTFSKIECDKKYRPGKYTVLAFAIALELTLEETESLLKTVGLAFSSNNKRDLIFEYFIRIGNYNISDIDAVLAKHDFPCLGCEK